GLSAILVHELLSRLNRPFPELPYWPLIGMPLDTLIRIASFVNPLAGIAVAMGFTLAVYEMNRTRIYLEAQHVALRAEIERRENAERQNLALVSRIHELEKSDSLVDMAGGF